jgi:DNA repair exonuclease SbcCD ATPase subunit
MGTLDTEFLHGMQLMFDLLKSQFDFVIVISHLDNIRDMVDNILEITNTNGYSHINILS